MKLDLNFRNYGMVCFWFSEEFNMLEIDIGFMFFYYLGLVYSFFVCGFVLVFIVFY